MAIGLLFVIVIVAIIIGATAWAISNGFANDERRFNEFADAGCIPTSWSFSGAPTTYSCPPGTPEDVGK